LIRKCSTYLRLGRKLTLISHRDGRRGAKRVAFGYEAGFINVDGTAAVMTVNDKGLACNTNPKPAALVADARAGSNVSFQWTKWLPSHQGPLTTYMAPYTGNLADVDVNNLRFFKIHEGGLYPDMQWAVDKMIAAGNVWNITIPHDIKPGTYVLRHELLALHFATEHSNAHQFGVVGPQFYIHCYNINVLWNGTAAPAGVTFPGAYRAMDPGLLFDIYLNNPNYPIPGPKPYVPSGTAPVLAPNKFTLMSATGDPAKDKQYYEEMKTELGFWEGITDAIYKIS